LSLSLTSVSCHSPTNSLLSPNCRSNDRIVVRQRNALSTRRGERFNDRELLKAAADVAPHHCAVGVGTRSRSRTATVLKLVNWRSNDPPPLLTCSAESMGPGGYVLAQALVARWMPRHSHSKSLSIPWTRRFRNPTKFVRTRVRSQRSARARGSAGPSKADGEYFSPRRAFTASTGNPPD
jgi:hypothetical protein